MATHESHKSYDPAAAEFIQQTNTDAKQSAAFVKEIADDARFNDLLSEVQQDLEMGLNMEDVPSEREKFRDGLIKKLDEAHVIAKKDAVKRKEVEDLQKDVLARYG